MLVMVLALSALNGPQPPSSTRGLQRLGDSIASPSAVHKDFKGSDKRCFQGQLESSSAQTLRHTLAGGQEPQVWAASVRHLQALHLVFPRGLPARAPRYQGTKGLRHYRVEKGGE